MKDPYTDEIISDFPSWIKKSAKSKKIATDAARYNALKYNYPEFVDNIYKYYVELEYSLPKCLEEFGINYGNTQFLVKYCGLKLRGAKEASNTKRVRDLYKKTCLNKYGVINVSQAEHIKKKKENAAIEKYGVINVFQAEEIKEKSKNTMLEKYNVTNSVHLPRRAHTGKISHPHRAIADIILDLGYNLDVEVPNLCRAYNPFLKREYSPIVDIKLKGYDIVIEIYGDTWHANPQKYKPSDLIPKYEGDTPAEEIWAFDKAREKQIRDAGYELIIIWDSEYHHNKQKTKEKLKNEIENCINKKAKS